MASVKDKKKEPKVPRRSRMGRYPNLQDHRIQAGMEISDLVAALNDAGPAERSIRRLEAARSIRLASVYRVFNLINSKLDGRLDASKEIVEL